MITQTTKARRVEWTTNAVMQEGILEVTFPAEYEAKRWELYYGVINRVRREADRVEALAVTLADQLAAAGIALPPQTGPLYIQPGHVRDTWSEDLGLPLDGLVEVMGMKA